MKTWFSYDNSSYCLWIWARLYFRLCCMKQLFSVEFTLDRMVIRTHFNSLWPSDAIWQQGSRSTLVQVMACCLTAPSHYLNQCWLIITSSDVHLGAILKQNHMVVAYFPWYFTRCPAWKPRPRRGSGFHAGSPSEVSWKICNNKCGFVFIPRLYP